MKINKLSMALVMAASLLAVTPLAQAQETNAPAAPARPRGGRGPTLESIDKAVTLTDAEKPKVQAALDELNTAIQAAREGDQSEARTKMRTAREDFNKKLKGILTPEQYAKLPQPGARRGGAAGGGAGTPPPANPPAGGQ